MNTYTLNFELVALEYDASVLQLLRLSCLPIAQIQKIKAQYWQKGKRRSFTADSNDKIISKVSIILEVLEKISFHFPDLQEKLLYTADIVRR